MARAASPPLPDARAIGLDTADGVRLAGVHLPAPDARRDLAVVLAHGFGGGVHRAGLRRVAAGLTPWAGVLTADLRGHGGSGGLCTVGDREVLDVDALVGAARGLGYCRVATVGWSMGGSAVVRHAGLRDDRVHGHALRWPPDEVVAVSATSRWFVDDTRPMRRVGWLAGTPLGRRAARRALGVRIDPTGWDPVPASPLEVIAAIRPLPLLLIHGDADPYFTLEHPRALAAASGARVWEVAGFGHAENAATPAMLARLGRDLASRITA